MIIVKARLFYLCELDNTNLWFHKKRILTTRIAQGVDLKGFELFAY